jgi:SAM-dependent methyltransferase
VEGYDQRTYGDRFADVYDDWYGDITDVEATVDRLADLAAGGEVLELGVGTGRIAVPLANLGVRVTGVDSSPAMLDRLRAKPGADRVEAVEADMAAPPLDTGRFRVVVLTFNTFFNLGDELTQRSCLEHAHRLLGEGGALVVETFVTGDDLASTGNRLEPRRLSADEVVLIATLLEPDGRTVSGQHVHLREDGIRLRPWRLRMLTPAELDELATAAGFAVEARWSDWHGAPFDDESTTQVVVYRR